MTEGGRQDEGGPADLINPLESPFKCLHELTEVIATAGTFIACPGSAAVSQPLQFHTNAFEDYRQTQGGVHPLPDLGGLLPFGETPHRVSSRKSYRQPFLAY